MTIGTAFGVISPVFATSSWTNVIAEGVLVGRSIVTRRVFEGRGALADPWIYHGTEIGVAHSGLAGYRRVFDVVRQWWRIR